MERLLQEHILREAVPHSTHVESTPGHSIDRVTRKPAEEVLSDRRSDAMRHISAASPVWTDTHAFLSKELMVQPSDVCDAHQHEAWLLDLLEKETKEVGNVIVATADRTAAMSTPRNARASVRYDRGSNTGNQIHARQTQ